MTWNINSSNIPPPGDLLLQKKKKQFNKWLPPPTAVSIVKFESNDAKVIAGALCLVIAAVNDFQKLVILGWMIFVALVHPELLKTTNMIDN